MKIYYHLSEYISHRLSGENFIAALRLMGHEVSSDPSRLTEAETAIIHDEPLHYLPILKRHPELQNKRRIGYSVWETETLPPQYADALKYMDEIWTCSEYCRNTFARHHAAVATVPHIVQRCRPRIAAVEKARALAQAAEDTVLFFSICDAINPRKNAAALLQAFTAVQRAAGKPVKLVIKQHRHYINFSSLPGVVCINGHLSNEEIAALHSISHAYVSAHHAEGWGLGLSEAMAYGKPVIATGYSGNMDFMDQSNSYPVKYKRVKVPQRMQDMLPLFNTDMEWADIDQNDLISNMMLVVTDKVPPYLGKNAAAICRKFSLQAVGEIMHSLLSAGSIPRK